MPIFLILIIIIIKLVLGDVSYCEDLENISNKDKGLMDTPIKIQFETTPNKLVSLLGNLGLTAGSFYTIYYGLRAGGWSAEYFNATPGTIFGLMTTLAITGGVYGLLTHAISKKIGKAPYIEVKVSTEKIENVVNKVKSENINSSYNIEDLTENINVVKSGFLDSEVIETIKSFIKFYVDPSMINKFDPLSNEPNIAIWSCCILFIIIVIQSINVMLFRYIIINKKERIISYLTNSPNNINKLILRMVRNILATQDFFYKVMFFIIYLNLIGAIISLLNIDIT